MIFNFKEFSILESNIIDKIKSVLTPDLLKGYWKNVNTDENPMAGHCYAATEALYWMLGGNESNWTPYVLNNKSFPEGLDEGGSHWFIKNNNGDILDPTKEQFGGLEVPYEKARPNYMMNHPKGGSKRAREIINRVNNSKMS